MRQTWCICRYCHQHKIIDSGGPGAYDVSSATSAAATHFGQNKRGHNLTKNGVKQPLQGGRGTIKQIIAASVKVPQDVANELGGFDQQRFRLVAVMWLVDNNHPLREFRSPSFREMMELANPAALAALWVSHNSVSDFVMKLFSALQRRVVKAIKTASSKIHISFDGWTTKGGKRGYLGIVAHFATADGDVLDIPIDLPQLIGAHTGERLAEAITLTLTTYGLKLGYFVLDNASNNHT
jgi:hypothetical protein